ncbi:MAG: glycosyl transferase group 1 [Phycisphaerales bacterium]|nr:glycosyl transferase group 1 [Phycisphaerales bacterium]
MPRRRKTLLVLSQVFVPDPASVGQHVADVAAEMARRGHRVRVYASARGYEDPTRRYPARETYHGVDVRRIDFASFGKKSLAARVLGTASFMGQVLFRCLTERDLGGIFFSTSPPLVGVVASVVGLLRGVPVAYWAMDLNPDQLIALGKLKPTGPAARALEAVNRFILRRSALVVALDRFMAGRLERRMPLAGKLLVMPPWPHEDHIAASPTDGVGLRDPAAAAAPAWTAGRDDNPFRRSNGWAGKFVVMYSGNHSPSNPLGTLLDAALRFRDDSSLVFAFVGGGTGKRDVEAHVARHALSNVVSLPYQPIENLRHSLAAADVHVVSLGADMVGIIHPCKIYGAMAAGRPVLYLGPRPSHVSDLLDAHPFGRAVAHGDVDGCAVAVDALRRAPTDELARMGATAADLLAASLTQRLLCGRFCDALERALGATRSAR